MCRTIDYGRTTIFSIDTVCFQKCSALKLLMFKFFRSFLCNKHISICQIYGRLNKKGQSFWTLHQTLIKTPFLVAHIQEYQTTFQAFQFSKPLFQYHAKKLHLLQQQKTTFFSEALVSDMPDMGSCLCGLPAFPPDCIVAKLKLTVTKCPLGKSCWPPLCLESEQLFVFNLSKLSWEFKPFVVAVNSTFFKSPASSSSRVSATLKHTSTNTAAAAGKHFSTRGSLVARVGRKNIAPFLFFSTRTRVILLHSRAEVWQSERFTMPVCNTQRAPPDMASISSRQQSSEWNQAGRCRRPCCCCILYIRLHLWIPPLRHYPCTDLCISTFSICSEWHTGICEGREISVVASIPAENRNRGQQGEGEGKL